MRRQAGLCVVFCAVALLAPSAAAASLASLTVPPTQVSAGSTVQVSGARFSASPMSSNIELHLGQRTGPVIASIAPTASFNTSVLIPAGTSAGDQLLVATQRLPSGFPVPGTPGRTRVRVVPASAVTGSSVALDQPSAPRGPDGWLLAIGLSLALAGVSVTLGGRRRTTTATDPLPSARRA